MARLDAQHENAAPVTKRVLGLDGLRTLAVGAVVLTHLYPQRFPGGRVGVDLFFVLSGYLITTLLVGEKQATGKVGVRNFYIRRALRLYPALILLIATVLAVSFVADSGEFTWTKSTSLSAALAFTYLSDLAVGWGAMPNLMVPLQHTWSLSVEEHFYLAWAPILGFLLYRKNLPLIRKGLIALVIFMTGWTVILGAVFNASIFRIDFAPDTRGVGLLIGCILAITLVQRPTLSAPKWMPWLATMILGLIVLVGGLDAANRWGAITGVGLLCVPIILGVLDADSSFARLCEVPLMVALGVRAYGIYLWHLPVVRFVNFDRFPEMSRVEVWVVDFVLIAILVEISYRFAEKPALRLRSRFTPSRKLPAAMP